MVADDLAQCKHCKFYCNHSTIKLMLDCADVEKTCPMCNTDVTLDDYQFVGEAGVSGLKRAPPKEENKKEKTETN